MRNILAICDSELEYAYHLMEALGRREDFPFEIQVYSSADKFCQHVAGSPVSLLMVAESDYAKEMEGPNVGQVLILLEGDSTTEDPIQDGAGPPGSGSFAVDSTAVSGGSSWREHPSISKYSSVSAIARKAMECTQLRGSLGSRSQHPNPISFIGIYTPVRRCLQTTFAFVTGQLLARSHRVLYLNFETYSGLGKMLGRSFTAEFTDLLYFLNGPKQQLLAKLYQMTENVNGMDVCPPAFCGADISQMKEEEWLKLLDVLEESRYEYVILDLSDGVQGLYEILRRCSKIYTIVREDGFAMAKIEQYEAVLSRAAYEDVLRKTRKCSLPVFRKLPRDLNHMTVGELAEYVEKMLRTEESGQC